MKGQNAVFKPKIVINKRFVTLAKFFVKSRKTAPFSINLCEISVQNNGLCREIQPANARFFKRKRVNIAEPRLKIRLFKCSARGLRKRFERGVGGDFAVSRAENFPPARVHSENVDISGRLGGNRFRYPEKTA